MAEFFVGTMADFPEAGRRMIRCGEDEVGVFRVKGRFYAYRNVCSHQGGPVCAGMIVGKVEAELDGDGRWVRDAFSEEEIHLVCPWHGVEYDITSGACVSERRWQLDAVEVVRRGEDIYVVR